MQNNKTCFQQCMIELMSSEHKTSVVINIPRMYRFQCHPFTC